MFKYLLTLKNLKKHLVDLSRDGKMILKCGFEKYFAKVWTELKWIRIGSYGNLL